MGKTLGIICTSYSLGDILKADFEKEGLYQGGITVARPLREGEAASTERTPFNLHCTHYLAHLNELSPEQAATLKKANPDCKIYAFSPKLGQRESYEGLAQIFDLAPSAWEACREAGKED